MALKYIVSFFKKATHLIPSSLYASSALLPEWTRLFHVRRTLIIFHNAFPAADVMLRRVFPAQSETNYCVCVFVLKMENVTQCNSLAHCCFYTAPSHTELVKYESFVIVPWGAPVEQWYKEREEITCGRDCEVVDNQKQDCHTGRRSSMCDQKPDWYVMLSNFNPNHFSWTKPNQAASVS